MNKLFKNIIVRIILGLILFVGIVWALIAVLSQHKPNYSLVSVERRDLNETVTVNGDVTSDQAVTLAFNMQGRVASIYTNVGSTTETGELLAKLDTGTLEASLAGAEADVLAAQAHLATLKRGARPEELALYQQKYNDATAALTVALKSSYLSTKDAITGKADSLFTNGNTVNPVINVKTNSQTESSSINMERVLISDKLNTWSNVLYSLNSNNHDASTIAEERQIASDVLVASKTFLDHLSVIVNNLSVGNSGLAQATINSYMSTVNTASQELASAINTEQGADAAWSAARDSLTLEQAGSTAEDIQAGQAALDKASAAVLGLENQIHQSYIVSPFEGVVTAMNVKVGEVYVPGISATEGISLIGNRDFKIESYVSESDVGKIQVGDKVSVSFDAYGPKNVFKAHVSLVDPAETMISGVKSYKVTIAFDDLSDQRIKSGLTANAIITTKMVSQALAVPSRALITRGADVFALVKSTDSSGYTEQKVETGIKSADGYTEIISGLNEGDAIAGFGNTN